MKMPNPNERLTRAETALEPYLEGGAASRTEAATDLLTDLMHLASQYNVDLYQCWQVAGRHHQLERG